MKTIGEKLKKARIESGSEKNGEGFRIDRSVYSQH